MNPLPWFQDGLSFSCTRCGNCCTGEPGYVWLNIEDVDGLAKARGVSRAAFLKRYCRLTEGKVALVEKTGGDCVFYDDHDGCLVNEHKPLQCRAFPFWSYYVQSEFHWSKLEHFCRGVNRGRCWSAEEVTAVAESYDLSAREYRAAMVLGGRASLSRENSS